MNRRDILKYTALATGAAISVPLASTILSGCRLDQSTNPGSGQLLFFNWDEMKLVKELVDIILPKTDSPSGTEVGVHTMIDAMVGTVYKAKDKNNYRKGFESLKQFFNRKIERSAAVQQLEGDANSSPKAARRAYMELKQQTVAYYLSTEEIGKNYLNYLPVPGEYRSCISLVEVGNKAWAI